MRPLLFSFWLLIAHDIAQGIQRGKGWWGGTMGHPRQGYRRHTGQCRQRFAIDMDGGRDIFACRSVSERIRPYLFPFGFLPPKLWDIKPRGNGKPWAMEPAVEDTDGRSASDRTRPRFFFFGFCSTRSPPTGAPASGIGYDFYQV